MRLQGNFESMSSSLDSMARTLSLLSAGMLLAGILACGSSPDPDPTATGGGGRDSMDGGGRPNVAGEHNLASLEVVPATAAIEILNGAIVTQSFKVVGHFDD